MNDPSIPLKHGKYEIIAQRMAMGDNKTDAARKAGYRSKDLSADAGKLIRRHPEILERAEYLKNRMFDRQVDTKIITRHELITSLMSTAKMAASLGRPQLSVVHSCYRTIAEMEGHLIRKSEVKRLKDDPFEDATPQQLIDTIERATNELGLNLDRKTLDAFIDSFPEDASPATRDDAHEAAGVLQAVPEAAGVPSPEDAAAAADGWEPAREV